MTDFDLHAMDMEELENAKALLKKRFPIMIEGYFEDASMYVENIDKGFNTNDIDLIAKNAHPLKSSSASLGITSVSTIAKAIEEQARSGVAADELKPLFDLLKQALAIAEPKLMGFV